LRALAKKPDNRYPTCHEFVHALSEAVLPQPSPAARRSPTPRVLTATILALLISLGFIIYHFVTKHLLPIAPESPPELPSGFVPDGETIINIHGKKHYQRIRYTELQGVDPLVFILIPKGAHLKMPSTFYIMENKVSREQFAAQLPRMETLLQQLSVQ